MDDGKCKALKEELAAQPEPQIVTGERFFDGNSMAAIWWTIREWTSFEMFSLVCFAARMCRQFTRRFMS